jgi:hypothetical protein
MHLNKGLVDFVATNIHSVSPPACHFQLQRTVIPVRQDHLSKVTLQNRTGTMSKKFEMAGG